MTDGYRRRPMWCHTHQEFAWEYDDGSVACWFDCIVEASSDDHDVTPIAKPYGVNYRWDGEQWRYQRTAVKAKEDA